jgi:hypothetical protein
MAAALGAIGTPGDQRARRSRRRIKIAIRTITMVPTPINTGIPFGLAPGRLRADRLGIAVPQLPMAGRLKPAPSRPP